jgi:NADP-dependent 3-hydroxy acid dehydrogenase YdfG
MTDPRSILITGATSGIGAALAEAYACPGVTLALTGRHEGRLSDIAERCRNLGARVIAEALDVADAGPLAAWIATVDSQAPLDLVHCQRRHFRRYRWRRRRGTGAAYLRGQSRRGA